MNEGEIADQAIVESRREAPQVIRELAELPEHALVDEAYLAGIFHKDPRTIRRWVADGELPAAIGLGKDQLWMAGRIIRHLDKRAEAAEKDAAERARKIRGMA